MYTDILLSALCDSGVGCYLGHVFAGALAYADDIVLLAPTKSALTRMLSVASECADMLSLKFNGTKSQYVRFRSGHGECDGDHVFFCGTKVPEIESGLHLGNILGAGSRDSVVEKAALDLQCRTNILLSRFSFCSPDVRYKLFKSQCMVAYGSQLWDFDSIFVDKFFTSWRKCVRRVWGLPNTTHGDLLPGICHDRSIELQLLSRSLNFVRNAAKSENILLKTSIGIALNGSSSAVSNSMCKLASEFHVSRDWIAFSRNSLPCFSGSSPRSAAIRDFAMMHYAADGEDRGQIREILQHMCIY